MSLFSRKQKLPMQTSDEKQGFLEIETHKNATKEAIAEAKQATQKLNSLLVENGFTLKIYLATGGHRNTKGKK